MIYRIKQSPSICPHCSNRNSVQSSSSQNSSSEEEQSHHARIIPLKKQVIQHNQNIEQTLTLLQEEVEKLKDENLEKENKIKLLEEELNIFNRGGKIRNTFRKGREVQEPETDRKYNIRGDYQQHTHHILNKNTSYPTKDIPQFPNFRENSIQQNYYPHYNIPNVPTSTQRREFPQFQHKNNNTSRKFYKSMSPRKALNDIEIQIKEISESKNQRIQILVQELIESRSIVEELRARLEEEVQQNEWLIKFCISFIKMVADIAHTQGLKVTDPMWSLRKNARVSWRYLKQFIKEVIQ